MKNILVATDFSNNAYCALFYAVKLLASKPCTFYLLNVFDELTPLYGKKPKLLGSKKRLEEVYIESKERLTETSHRILMDNDNPLHRFETLSEKGMLTTIISKTLSKKQIDLVVMGNKGLTEAADIFFGSNTIRALKKINRCPVLAIPGEMDFKQPKEIAFVTDFKKGCAHETMKPLLFLASLAKASIRVLHITEEEILNNEQESRRKLLESCLEGVEHSFHWMQAFDDKAKVIDAFLKKLEVDLYAMVNRKHSLFEKLTREPVIMDVSMYSETPLLILPQQD
ncbi:Nucleotide-binding universal stress protein, UspA family [Pricia antarctica]|uniref:Nucleotide-binding universal stress protein, UspA family n=1 Tax=Pricia antarctica TaxID=641691 RepID=A0A1G7CYT3_9FLAO|nr:universal stress protein [Pricia antarctica]SDE44431.1 Nucleotide-binding universal stress protein, UspA family [Pricia antarctica]